MENILFTMSFSSIIKHKEADAGFHKILISFLIADYIGHELWEEMYNAEKPLSHQNPNCFPSCHAKFRYYPSTEECHTSEHLSVNQA